MLDVSRGLGSVSAAQILLNRSAALRDNETRVAAVLRKPERSEPHNGNSPQPQTPASESRACDLKLRRIADYILRTVEARLPGRVRDLEVQVEDGAFVLSGVSSSYYVKQMAQHLAMTALDNRMLGKLVNEIEVRTVR